MPVSECLLLGLFLTQFDKFGAGTKVIPRIFKLGGWSVELDSGDQNLAVSLRPKAGRHVLSGVKYLGNETIVKEREVDLSAEGDNGEQQQRAHYQEVTEEIVNFLSANA